MNIKKILDRFELDSIRRMFNNAKMVANYSNHSIFYVLYDMSKCILKDNIGYMEYNFFHFIDKPQELRDTFIDFDCSRKIFDMLNDKQANVTFDNKLLFNATFKDYIGREFIDAAHCSYEDFEKYCKGKKQIFCKPKDSCSGKGIYKSIEINKDTDLKQLHQFMIDNELFCEDVIDQHEEMNKLNKTSINTIRITTICKDGKAHYMYALLRMGINDMKVDNIASGGIYTVLSDEGEIVNPCWSDKTIRTYEVHPTNGFKLIGFKVPMFKEAIELCKKAALVEQRVGYVGWDVAITKKGPVLVEGNQLPGYDMPQNYFATKNEVGLKPAFEKILGKLN